MTISKETQRPKRPKMPQDIETKVLTLSRRRCCLCFGLKADFDEKKGQIAHLDNNRANNKLENLAFLCLDHHDTYDSKTSQSKGIKGKEVKNYREELYYNVMTKLPCDNIEKEELKSLWKQIASGDFKSNNYSERLKQTLTTIDQVEAGYFNKLADFIWCDRDKKNLYLIYNDDVLAYLKEKYDLTTTVFQSLADFNLIDNVPKAVILNKGKSASLQYHSHGYCFTSKDLDVYLQVKPLTRLGKELYELCEPKFRLDYLDCVLYTEGDKLDIASSSFNRPPRPLVEDIEKQIAKKLNKHHDDLTDDDFQQTTEITIYHSNKNDNIEKLVNLKWVTFLGVTPKFMEEISRIESVECIIFEYCCIPDISILRNMKNLTRLSFRNVNDFDLNILADWKSITNIGFGIRKGVPNLSLLSKVPNLKSLGFCAMEIDDISFIQGIPNLEDIILNQTLVTNLRPFGKLDKIKSISLSMTKVAKLDGLQSLSSLENLKLNSTKVSDISKLQNCINIKKLNLSHSHVSDINPLKGMQNLEELFLASTKVNDISVLNSLVNLKKLRLNNISVSDWTPLKTLVNLEELDLSGNNIQDFSFISGMKSLRRLNLQKAKITDLEPLSQLTQIDSINLNNVEFPSLSPIQKLSIKELDLQKARTSGYEFLSAIKSLEVLKIDDSQTNLDFLKTLPLLKKLFLSNVQIQSCKLLLNLNELEALTLANVPVQDYDVLKDLNNLTLLSTNSSMKELLKLRLACPKLIISGNGWTDRRDDF